MTARDPESRSGGPPRGERGAARKNWGEARIRVALAFPNTYAVGMSSLGFQAVYGALNTLPGVACERVFHPGPEGAETLRRARQSLATLDSGHLVRDAHLLAFSVPFEPDAERVVEMLSLSGIPARAKDRTGAHPLVAVGGVAAFLNPQPLSPFTDFFFAGEAEAILPDFWAFWERVEHGGGDVARPDLLLRLAREVPGIYVPSLYEERRERDGAFAGIAPLAEGIPARVACRRADLAQSPPCTTVILTPETEFSDTILTEIGRGCGRGCRFCAAGYVFRPPRFHDAEKIFTAVAGRLSETDRVGLVSAAVSDHPEVDALCETLLARGARLGFSSLRADTLTPEIAACLPKSGMAAVAIAPDAGTERLRRVINKHISDEDIFGAATLLADMGVTSLKLYFMIGLPTETLADIDGIVALVKGVKHHVLSASRGRKRLGTITLSVHSFVPKPFTPFQWAPFLDVRELKERARRLRDALGRVANVRVHFDVPKWAFVQALLARGDSRVADLIERVALSGVPWPEALKNAPWNPDHTVLRERGADEPFPWEILDHGVSREYLRHEYERALLGEETPRCAGGGKCREPCGACP